MTDDTQKPAPSERQDQVGDEPARGKPKLAASKELSSLVKAQRPRGAIGRVKADGNQRTARPAALPVPHKRNVSAYTPAPVIERWNAEAAGVVSAVEVGDNVITMFGTIGEDFWTGEGVTAKKVTAQLRAIGPRPVEVHINSFGGDMFEGISIYNVLREHPQDVTIKVMGIAASAASIITMAGDRVEIGAGSFIMIHNCSVMGGGNRHDFLELAAFLEPFDRVCRAVTKPSTGASASC